MPNCRFNELWLQDARFSKWIAKDPKSVNSALCRFCKGKSIDIKTMGASALNSHMKGKRHCELVKMHEHSGGGILTHFAAKSSTASSSFATVSSAPITPILLPTTVSSSETTSIASASTTCAATLNSFAIKEQVLKAELWWALKSASSSYSFHSSNDISFIMKKMFPSDETASKFACGETKVMYLICHGIAPYLRTCLTDKLRDQQYVLMFDESYNKFMKSKQMDILVRFWDVNNVVSRYYDSKFMGHARCSDIYDCIHESVESSLGYKNIVQLSMDGPNVNWSFHNKFESSKRDNFNSGLVNVGSCSLHKIHNAFKEGAKKSGWQIPGFLYALYNLFHETPARREDYEKVTSSDVFPLKYCAHRWVENVSVAERAINMLPFIKVYVTEVKNKKLPNPSTKSYSTVEDSCEDPLLEAKLQCYISVAKPLDGYLVKYQTDKPMLPFLCNDLEKLLKLLLRRFIKDAKLQEANTITQLLAIDFSDASNQVGYSRVDVGFAADRILRTLLVKKKVSDLQAMQFRTDCKTFLLTLITHLLRRNPLKYTIVKNLNCLDPALVCNPELKSKNEKKMKCILNHLVKSGLVQITDCDQVLHEFSEFLALSSTVSAFTNFTDSDRLDNIYFQLLSGNHIYAKLWPVVKMLLLLSHGQASVERGFSINNTVADVNLSASNLIARRLVKDHVNAIGGLENMTITKELVTSARAARSRYQASLLEKQQIKKQSQKNEKRKLHVEEVNHLKEKKRKTEEEIKSLHKSADDLAKKAEDLSKLLLLTQSNSLRKTAHEKENSLKHVEKLLNDKLLELKNL